MEELAKKSNLQAFDRVAALLADIFILFPVILLLTSGVREKLNELVTLGFTSELMTGKILILFVSLGVISFYRTFFQFFCSKSIGQKLLKIEIHQLNKDTVNILYFIRLFLWNFVGLLFPFCFLNVSIYYSEQAESIFDKLFGLKLSTYRESAYRYKIFSKNHIRKGFEVAGFVGVLAFLMMVGYLTKSYQQKSIDQSLSDGSDLNYPICDEITEYHENWRDDSLTSSRIETAITLFGIGKISEKCLSVEANFALRANSSDELGYLAAYLVSQSPDSSTSFLRDLYLKRICDEAPESEACSFSKSLSTGDSIDQGPFLISKVWGVKRDLIFGKFKAARSKLHSLPKAFGFDLFMTQMNVKLKSLLSSDSYSDLDMGVALSSMDNINQLEFSRWICYEDLKGKCGKPLTSACSHFVKRAEVSEDLVLEDNYLLGKIKSCNKDFATISKKGINKTVLKYAGDQKSLEEVIFAPGVPEFIKLDAIHRLVEITKTKDDVVGLASEWARQDERDFRWRKLGELLAYKLQSIQEKEMASKVFYNLVKEYGKEEFLYDGVNVRLPASLKED